jgi:hypothetical protein
MHLYELIPWLGSLALESLLVFSILKNGIHRRFPVFFAFIIFDIFRAVALPAIYYAPPSPYAYFYSYWISVPVEYTLTLFIVFEVFLYIFGGHIKHKSGVVRAFTVFALALLLASVILLLRPSIPVKHLTGMILTANRSVSLLMAGLFFFMWSYSSRIGFSMRDHVWGIVFGFGVYSSTSLIVAAIHAFTGQMCPGWVTPLPHFAYLGSTAIWNAYLWKPEPEIPPLTDEELEQYQNAVSTYRTVIKDVRKALQDERPDSSAKHLA